MVAWFRRLSWVAGVAIAVVGVRWVIEGYGARAAPWILIGALMAARSLGNRIPGTSRKAAIVALLLGLVALFAWLAVARYREGQLAVAVVDGYLAVVSAGLATWAAFIWVPGESSASAMPRFLRGAVTAGLVAGLALTLGFSIAASGSVLLAVIAWVVSAVFAAVAVAAMLIRRRVESQQSLAHRLGFDDLHVYVEARQRQGVTFGEMATETGMNIGALRRADRAWASFRRFTST